MNLSLPFADLTLRCRCAVARVIGAQKGTNKGTNKCTAGLGAFKDGAPPGAPMSEGSGA